ncbi:MAG: T9SS type A sorting domain-containing protein [Bacteroidales bacterium]|nr:T9SS type A sorting domain-containing protein [Bacteroidales bacterium]
MKAIVLFLNFSFGVYCLIAQSLSLRNNLIEYSKLYPKSKEYKSFYYLPDTIKLYNVNNELDKRIIMEYDNMGNKLIELTQIHNANQWENYERVICSYNSSNLLVSRINEHWENNAWTGNFRESYQYDSNNNLISYIVELYLNNAWTNYTRRLYSFDYNNNLLYYSYETWDIDHWKKEIKYEYTYDANGNLLTELQLIDGGTDWINNMLYVYSYYTNQLMKELLISKWISGNWMNLQKTEYTYTLSGKKQEEKNLFWNQSLNDWDIYDRMLYSYNGNDSLEYKIYQQWVASSWQNSNRLYYEYNSFGFTTLERYENWYNNQWEPTNKLIITYNSNNKPIHKLQQIWEQNAWQNYQQYFYMYNNNDKLIQESFEIWQNNAWVPIYIYSYELDVQNNLLSETRENWYNGDQYISKLSFIYDVNNNSVEGKYEYWEVGSGWSPFYYNDMPVYSNQLAVYLINNTCRYEANFKQFTTYNKENTRDDSSVKMYPNPTNDCIWLDFSKKIDQCHYSIFNSLGILIKQGTLSSSNNKIAVSEIANGVYLLHLIYENNKEVKTFTILR